MVKRGHFFEKVAEQGLSGHCRADHEPPRVAKVHDKPKQRTVFMGTPIRATHCPSKPKGKSVIFCSIEPWMLSVVTQLTIGFIQALVCMCGWAVRWLHANTSLMHAMHAMLRPVWGQSGLRSISYMALKGACRNRTWRSPRHARIAELQTDWRNSPTISSLRHIISL